MDTKDYVTEANRQLDDTSTYTKLDKDPTDEFNLVVETYLTKMVENGDITKKVKKILHLNKPRTPQIYVTQRGNWCPSGELGNSSKAIVKGYMEKNMTNRPILFKNFTKVEFYGENDKIYRNIRKCLTIALWEVCRSNVFNSLILRITGVCTLPWQQ